MAATHAVPVQTRRAVEGVANDVAVRHAKDGEFAALEALSIARIVALLDGQRFSGVSAAPRRTGGIPVSRYIPTGERGCWDGIVK